MSLAEAETVKPGLSASCHPIQCNCLEVDKDDSSPHLVDLISALGRSRGRLLDLQITGNPDMDRAPELSGPASPVTTVTRRTDRCDEILAAAHGVRGKLLGNTK